MTPAQVKYARERVAALLRTAPQPAALPTPLEVQEAESVIDNWRHIRGNHTNHLRQEQKRVATEYEQRILLLAEASEAFNLLNELELRLSSLT